MLILPIVISAAPTRWGWGSHRYINDHALDYLPTEMSFFQDQRTFIREHAVDPDQSDNRPGYWHYIDIDYYPEFFNGTLPTDLNALINLYNSYTVTNNGTVPWAITTEMDSVSALMAAGNWTIVWQAVADLGHYVADSHQPMHLTENYNGQMTGNYGIHSRYETTLTNAHLDYLALPVGIAEYWENPIDTIFQYIDEVYPYVGLVLAADDVASAQNPSYGSVYYNLMWDALDSITTDAIHRSILDLASAWYTAWVNAGNPYPPGVGIVSEIQPTKFFLNQNFPNAFNPGTTIRYVLARPSDVNLVILNLKGQVIRSFASGKQPKGEYSLDWDGRDNSGRLVNTGLYFARLTTSGGSQVIKMTYLK